MEEKNCPLKRVFADGHYEESVFALVCQAELCVLLNHRPMITLTCTDSFLPELTAGYLLSEGYLSDQRIVSVIESENAVDVITDRAEPQKKEPEIAVPSQTVFHLAAAFSQDSKLHKITQGVHSCYLAYDDAVIFSAEDLSRHNALDKVIGHALLKQLSFSRCAIYFTGRVSTHIVKKMLCAGLPVLISKGVPTWDAVQLAKENGLHLICRAWPDSYDVFT